MSTTDRTVDPLAQETLRAIASTGIVRNFPKNAVLINEGDTGDSLYIVLSGRVKVYASNESGRTRLLISISVFQVAP